jgi:hypothetical protein
MMLAMVLATSGERSAYYRLTKWGLSRGHLWAICAASPLYLGVFCR